MAFTFPELIQFGGSPLPPEICEPKDLIAPNVFLDQSPSPQDMWLCLVGFPMYSILQVEIYDPADRLVGSSCYQVVEERIFRTDYRSHTLVYVNGMNSFAVPPGTWRVRLTSGAQIQDYEFPIKMDQAATAPPMISQSPLPAGIQVNPFDRFYDSKYRPGETIYFQGEHFPPNADLLLGLYYQLEPISTVQGLKYQLEPISTLQAHTNSLGIFSLTLDVKESNPAGVYALIPSSFFNEEDRPRYDYPKFTIYRSEYTYSCEGPSPLASRLVENGYAVLADPKRSQVRDIFGFSSKVIGEIQAGQPVCLVDGGWCIEGAYWWEVYDPKTGLKGWMPEGDQEAYWLEPRF